MFSIWFNINYLFILNLVKQCDTGACVKSKCNCCPGYSYYDPFFGTTGCTSKYNLKYIKSIYGWFP